jgi:hypothetical protein
MMLLYLEREREREYRGGSASFEAYERRRGRRENNRRDITERFLNFTTARSIKGVKKRLITLSSLFGKAI